MTLELFSSTSTSQYNPGPGQYNADPYRTIGGPLSLKYSIKRNHQSTFQTKDTTTSKVDYMPLPNTLDHLPRYCKIANRYESKPPVPIVGPSYCPPSDFKNQKAFSIKSRYPPQDATISPGPGAYNVRTVSKSHPPPMGSRPLIVLSDASCSPGPGAYNVSRDIGQNSLKFSIRPVTAQAEVEREDPGYAYNHPSSLGNDQPKFTISRNTPSRDYANDIPGPGTYHPRDSDGSRIGCRIHPKIEITPQPQVDVPYENTRRFPDNSRPATIHRKCGRQYFTSDNSIPGPTWVPANEPGRQHFLGKRELPPPRDYGQTPGPCSYNLNNQLRNSEPQFSFKGPMIRDDWLPKSKTGPGPGEYEPKSGNNLPKWTIGHRSISRAKQIRAKTVAFERDQQAAPQERKVHTSLH